MQPFGAIRRVALFRALRRVAAVAGVLALVAQVLMPLSQPQAAWVEQGLFPPTCSLHGGDLAADLAKLDSCRDCPLCQAPDGHALVPMTHRAVSAAFAPVPVVVSPPVRSPGTAGVAARPPLPSRGPPAAA